MIKKEYQTDQEIARHGRSCRALLITLAFATMASAPIHVYERFVDYPWILAAIISLTLAAIGIKDWYRQAAGRFFATFPLVIWMAGLILKFPDQPGRGLFLLLALVTMIAYIWPAWRLLGPHFAGEDGPGREDLLLATLVALFIGIDKWKTSSNEYIIQAIALSLTFAVPAIRAFKFAPKKGRFRRHLFLGMLWLGLLLALAPVASNRTWDEFYEHVGFAPIGLLSPLLVIFGIGWRFILQWAAPAASTFRASRSESRLGGGLNSTTTLLDAVLTNPARVLVISFLFICVMGTGFLHLPLSTPSETQLSWIDSAFTSVSATCVTGLTVINPVEDLSGFGQLVLLSLIQIGGIGMMVFSSAAILILGGRLSMSQERVAVDMVGANSRSDLWNTMKAVFLVTLITETIAAICLTCGFLYEGEPFWQSVWKGIFTAISAFCNAGFALQGDSLVSYNLNPFIIYTVAATIAIAGVGPTVVVATFLWNKPERRTLHARIVLLATFALIFIPAFLILIFEWNATLAPFTLSDKISNAIFQSVTLRTAGFNSIDLTQMRPITWTIMEVIMFIGGSPGSTAGGVKTTTMSIILLAIVAVVRGEDRIEIFGRTIPHITVLRAAAIVTLGFVFFVCALTAIQLTQTLDLQTAMFEVVSAVATVGLSLDGTSQLDEIGMIIIMACMFAGRVGPISLFVFFAASDKRKQPKRFPEESLPVG